MSRYTTKLRFIVEKALKEKGLSNEEYNRKQIYDILGIGVENTNTDKKERLIPHEAMSNMGDVEAQRLARLDSRKQYCEEVNEMLGLNIRCDFRPGMKENTVGTGGNSGYEGGSLWSALKSALKGGKK